MQFWYGNATHTINGLKCMRLSNDVYLELVDEPGPKQELKEKHKSHLKGCAY